jgi:hypothetical protein
VESLAESSELNVPPLPLQAVTVAPVSEIAIVVPAGIVTAAFEARTVSLPAAHLASLTV